MITVLDGHLIDDETLNWEPSCPMCWGIWAFLLIISVICVTAGALSK